MKLIITAQILLSLIISSTTVLIPQSAKAQLPAIVDPNQPEQTNGGSEVITASAATLKVSCQDAKTVVQKGELSAVMVTWSYDGFGKDFSPAKRCQLVSEKLQQAADSNGGTFKNLQLSSGTVNSQPVICALGSNDKKCTKNNLLFTLKPENARNPEAVIQKIFGFARDGSSDLDESSGPKVDMNLGNWEQKAFAKSGKPAMVKRPTVKPNTDKKRIIHTGF
jgi:hypothetical protein